MATNNRINGPPRYPGFSGKLFKRSRLLDGTQKVYWLGGFNPSGGSGAYGAPTTVPGENFPILMPRVVRIFSPGALDNTLQFLLRDMIDDIDDEQQNFYHNKREPPVISGGATFYFSSSQSVNTPTPTAADITANEYWGTDIYHIIIASTIGSTGDSYHLSDGTRTAGQVAALAADIAKVNSCKEQFPRYHIRLALVDNILLLPPVLQPFFAASRATAQSIYGSEIPAALGSQYCTYAGTFNPPAPAASFFRSHIDEWFGFDE